jgi:hypothetical protein
MWRRKLVLCISYKMKYLQNEARKQKSDKEVTLQFSMIFQIRQKNNTVNFRVICPLNRISQNGQTFPRWQFITLLFPFLGEIIPIKKSNKFHKFQTPRPNKQTYYKQNNKFTWAPHLMTMNFKYITDCYVEGLA